MYWYQFEYSIDMEHCGVLIQKLDSAGKHNTIYYAWASISTRKLTVRPGAAERVRRPGTAARTGYKRMEHSYPIITARPPCSAGQTDFEFTWFIIPSFCKTITSLVIVACHPPEVTIIEFVTNGGWLTKMMSPTGWRCCLVQWCESPHRPGCSTEYKRNKNNIIQPLYFHHYLACALFHNSKYL